MSIVAEALAKKKQAEAYEQKLRLRPRTLREPDNDTFYCDVKNKKFQVGCCKILDHYPNGDCRVLTPNGVQFTARAEEVFYIRKGDYHMIPDLG